MHTNLREVAVANNIPIYAGVAKVANCHGNGRCGTCRVELQGSAIKPRNSIEEAKLGNVRSASGITTEAQKDLPNLRLACQIEVLGDLVVKTQG